MHRSSFHQLIDVSLLVFTKATKHEPPLLRVLTRLHHIGETNSCNFLSIPVYYILIKYLKPCEDYLEQFACICITDTKVFLFKYCNWTRTHSLWNAYVTWQEHTVFLSFVKVKLSFFKDTLLQIWKSPYMFMFIWKQCLENFTLLILKILELFVCKFPKCLFTNIRKQKNVLKK